jgi:hypothetical protein
MLRIFINVYIYMYISFKNPYPETEIIHSIGYARGYNEWHPSFPAFIPSRISNTRQHAGLTPLNLAIIYKPKLWHRSKEGPFYLAKSEYFLCAP